jgi:hypothetical protein
MNLQTATRATFQASIVVTDFTAQFSCTNTEDDTLSKL